MLLPLAGRGVPGSAIGLGWNYHWGSASCVCWTGRDAPRGDLMERRAMEGLALFFLPLFSPVFEARAPYTSFYLLFHPLSYLGFLI